MLSYLRRTLPVVARAFANRDGALVSRLDRRVRLRELDINRHMNQAVYAQVMELSRTDWVIRSGALKQWRAHGTNPVVASQHIVYRRELSLGQRYVLDSRAIGFDGRLLRVQTNVLVGDRVHARNDAELIFLGRDGVLGEEAVREACEGLTVDALAVDDWRVR